MALATSTRLRRVVVVTLGVVALCVAYFAFTFVQVWWAAGRDDRSHADAIIVMGAAQWDGQPSPVFKARLDHAAELFEQGVAPVVIVTGGKQEGDRVTQGFAGLEYLMGLGVPEEAIKVEVGGTNSFEELSAASVILRDADLGARVLVVSDPYHSLRIRGIAGEVGMDAHVSPTDSSGSTRSYLRETLAVGLGRMVGYRRMANW